MLVKVPERFDFDTRADFAGLVRDWRERLEAIDPYRPVVPRQGIFPEESAKIADLYRAIESDPKKSAAAFYEPGKFPEVRNFYDAYSKYQDLIKEELRNRGAVPIRERFRAFEKGTGLDDYSPVDKYDNTGAFRAAEHESYSHQIPYEEGFALDYRPFDAGYTPEGTRLVLPGSTVTPLNENLAGVADIVFDTLRKGRADDFPYSAFGESLAPNNVALLDDYLREPGRLSTDSRSLLSTRLGLAYPENLRKPQELNPSLESDVVRAGNMFMNKYLRPAFDQMQGLIRTQFPGMPEDAREFLYAHIYKPTLERMDKEFGGNVADLGNYYFAGNPITSAAKGAVEAIRKNPSGVAGGAAMTLLNDKVAEALAKDDYKTAATEAAKDVALGAATETGLKQVAAPLARRVAPAAAARVAPYVAGAARVGIPAAVGTGLFMQGRTGSALDTLANKAATVVPGLKADPKVDVGRRAGQAISNEARYVLNSILQNKVPYLKGRLF